MFHTLNFFLLNTSWFLWCCRVWWGENVALGVHFPFPSAPWALQKMTRLSCSLERTFSASPDNLLSKDTSCFSFVYTVQAVTVSHISGRLFLHGFFKNLLQNILSLPKDKGKQIVGFSSLLKHIKDFSQQKTLKICSSIFKFFGSLSVGKNKSLTMKAPHQNWVN